VFKSLAGGPLGEKVRLNFLFCLDGGFRSMSVAVTEPGRPQEFPRPAPLETQCFRPLTFDGSFLLGNACTPTSVVCRVGSILNGGWTAPRVAMTLATPLASRAAILNLQSTTANGWTLTPR